MEFHEVANLFPMMQDEEFQSLCADIAKNGQLEDIWLHEGKIIDGRNRYNACIEVGVTPKYREWGGGGSLIKFVLSLNLHRRHLTSGQRAALAVEVLPALEAEARAMKSKGGKKTKEDFKKQDDQFFDHLVGKRNPQATQQAATLLNTNRQYVSDAKKLKRDAPDLFEAVRTGEVSIGIAKREHADRVAIDAPLPPPEKGKYHDSHLWTEDQWYDDFVEDTKHIDSELARYDGMSEREIERESYEVLQELADNAGVDFNRNDYVTPYDRLLLEKAVVDSPRAAWAIYRKYDVRYVETIEILNRLYKSKDSPTSSGTFDTIAATGYIQPTGEGDQVHISKEPAFLEYALDKIYRLHKETAAQAKTPHVGHNSGEIEHYTPSEYVEAARKTMTIIDLDPFSCDSANETVNAKSYYTKEDDGLSEKWYGNVWMNPPYEASFIRKACLKLKEEVIAGRVSQACVITNNGTETEYFNTLLDITTAICFPNHRVRFWNADKKRKGSGPLQGQAIFYIGDNVERFADNFRCFGRVSRWLEI